MAQGVRVPEAGQNDECKVPARSLSRKKMVDLLYQRTQHYPNLPMIPIYSVVSISFSICFSI